MRRFGGCVSAAVVLLLLSACATRTAGQIPAETPSSIAAHAPAVHGPAVRGVVRDTRGRPVAGATVIVAVELSDSESFTRGFAAVTSLGLSCTIGCSAPHASGFSARDGSFAVRVPGPNPNHDRYSVTVAYASAPHARIATSLDLSRRARHGMKVGAVSVATGSSHIGAQAPDRFEVLPPSLPGRFQPHDTRAYYNTETGDPPVIDGSQADISNGYDPRLLEDEQVLLTTEQSGVEGRRTAIFSSSLDVVGHAVPASRHATCYVTGSRGQRIQQPHCGLTDGVLDTDWSPKDDPRCNDGPCHGPVGRHDREVTVVLAHPLSAQLLVIRGCNECTYATSADGRHFGGYVTSNRSVADDVVSQSMPGTRVRAVRVRTDTGGFFTSLREVSVFGT